ncbi:Hypothetical protein GLP15_4440 [Giardia lamblia P15]|uniref:OST3 / OST6 family protein n=1 Tax=Giardia intestinalis (strain P15) TaxID=658858 RepID=E1F5K7_GIAIA|nr:Hypothetical protein GLP15_4440 [Giardia lamblia P15]
MTKRIQRGQTVTLRKRIDKAWSLCDNLVTGAYRHIKPFYFYILLCIAYMFSTSGVIYNIINTPPPYGIERVGINETKPVFIANGMMTQYSTEGYVSGLLNLVAGVSLVLALVELRSKRCNGLLVCIYVFTFCASCLIQKRRFNKKTGM